MKPASTVVSKIAAEPFPVRVKGAMGPTTMVL